MHRFALPLIVGDDVITDTPVLGFVINDMFIHDLFLSECGRFPVHPVEAYGVSKEDATQLLTLNRLVEDATQAAINAGCRAVQEALGIATGDVAGAHFSGADTVRPFAQAMCEYLRTEYLMNATSAATPS